jgi:hypothetical protein
VKEESRKNLIANMKRLRNMRVHQEDPFIEDHQEKKVKLIEELKLMMNLLMEIIKIHL